jgi:hypothetical protein
MFLEKSLSRDRLYDTLDFQRPNVDHLVPHYQSSKFIFQDEKQKEKVVNNNNSEAEKEKETGDTGNESYV